MATTRVFRIPSNTQLDSYLTQTSASTVYASKTSPDFINDISIKGTTPELNFLNPSGSVVSTVTHYGFEIPGEAEMVVTANPTEAYKKSSLYLYAGHAELITDIGSMSSLAAGVDKVYGFGVHHGTNGTLLKVDTSGRVTKPSQPYFHVRSTQATAVGNDVLWSVIDNNVGSSYTSANGRFTAPVAGTYFFSAHGLWNNADAGDMRIALYKNAAGINGNRFILTKTASNWMTFYLNDIIYLAAGDYVTVRYLQGTNTLHVDADYNGFRGWLLG